MENQEIIDRLKESVFWELKPGTCVDVTEEGAILNCHEEINGVVYTQKIGTRKRTLEFMGFLGDYCDTTLKECVETHGLPNGDKTCFIFFLNGYWGGFIGGGRREVFMSVDKVEKDRMTFSFGRYATDKDGAYMEVSKKEQ